MCVSRLVLFADLFLNLVGILVFSNDYLVYNFVATIILIIINRTSLQVVLLDFIDSSKLLWVEIQAQVSDEMKVGILDIKDKLVLLFNLPLLAQMFVIRLRVGGEKLLIFLIWINLIFHQLFLKPLVLTRQTFELLQTFVVLNTVTQLVAEAFLLNRLASLTYFACIQRFF